MTISKEVNVSLGDPDGEAAPVLTCVCGTTHRPWEVFISIYDDSARPMPCCGRRLYFRNSVRVYQVEAQS